MKLGPELSSKMKLGPEWKEYIFKNLLNFRTWKMPKKMPKIFRLNCSTKSKDYVFKNILETAFLNLTTSTISGQPWRSLDVISAKNTGTRSKQ